jgi:hypothetical protein
VTETCLRIWRGPGALNKINKQLSCLETGPTMPSEQKIEFRRPASVYTLSVSVHDDAPARLANAHQASSQSPALNPAKDSGPNGEHKQRRPADRAVPHHSPLEMAGVLVHVTIGPACVVGGKSARTQVNDHRPLPSRPAGPAPNNSPATVSSAAQRSRMFIKLHRPSRETAHPSRGRER